MGYFETKRWDSDSWYGASGAYQAYVPDLLCGIDLRLDASVASALSQAAAKMRELDLGAATLTDTEPIARILMRSEALASSRIEGMVAPAKKILEVEALDEIGVSRRLDSSEAAVLANITAMRSAIQAVKPGDAVNVDALCEINRQLLQFSPLASEAGKVRNVQNWIGGNDYSPVGAAYVPPSPEHVAALLADLVGFCASSTLPPLAKASLAHAQFESIHPFVDGNGRCGRALMQVILRSSGEVTRTVPPISLALATDKGGYIQRLSAFRTEGTSALEGPGVQELLAYFAQKTIEACDLALVFEKRIALLQESWHARVKPRAKSTASVLLQVLPGNPVVTVSSAARLTGRSNEAARLAVASLVEGGVLTQSSRNRKSGLYTADEVLAEFNALERALATAGGDTAVQKPSRAVPQRR